MAANDPSSKQSYTPWVIAGIAVVGAFFLALCLGTAGFLVGRYTAGSAESVAEVEEVTREATVEAPAPDLSEGGDGETAESTDSADAPTPQPPAPQPTDTAAAETAETRSQQELQERNTNTEDIDFDVFYEAWDVIEEEFDGSIPNNEELLHSAIQGSLEALNDEYTRYIPPGVAERLREDMGGSVEGIGAFVRETEEGAIEIVRPIDGQPADIAGLKPGDIIIGVDGEDVRDQSLDEVILKVRGPRGTDVTLTVLRGDDEEELEFTITRTRFEIPIIESEMLEDDIAYIRLGEFNRNAEEKLLEAMEEMLAQNPQGLVFDLRDNPGGFLDQSVAVADVFLEDSIILYERNRSGLERVFEADDGDVGEEIPLVVLINAGSASASEIVAGAIKDNGRAILVGETTFGKGSVQQVHELSDGSELRVTIARWYTPGDKTIDGQGIAPDIEVASPDDLGGEDDPQLQRAVEYLLSGGEE